jgi:uncharacterized protein (DUF2062 family)
MSRRKNRTSLRRRMLQLFLKVAPRKRKLKGGILHRLVGDRLFDPDVWKLSARSVSAGLGVGTFVALTPTFPMQMIIAAVLAYVFRVNVPAALAACWITNPLTMPIIFPLEYYLGSWISSVFSLPDVADFAQPLEETSEILEMIDIKEKTYSFKITMSNMKNLIIGSLICSTTIALLVYGIFYFLFSRIQERRENKLNK